MSHLGSPADKRCDILTTGILICCCNNANKVLSCIYAIFLLLIIFLILSFQINLATTRRLRLEEFIYHFCLFIYIMLNLTVISNVVGNTVQGLTKRMLRLN